MPTPFPGMDPYLEEPWLWSDFHMTFTVNLRMELIKRLPARYVALTDRYVWIQDPDDESIARLRRPDAFVVDKEPRPATAQTATITAPVEIMLPSLSEKGSPYLKIVDRFNRRLVTVVEMLSTANKTPGKDREAYLLKRSEYLASGVNLVEIDFLRKGSRAPWGTPPPPVKDYYVMVSRASDRPRAGIWPFTVREPLPIIPIPLNAGDAEIEFALEGCFRQTYDSAGYERELDYNQPPVPPLDEPDATWARELLARLTASNSPPSSSGDHQ